MASWTLIFALHLCPLQQQKNELTNSFCVATQDFWAHECVFLKHPETKGEIHPVTQIHKSSTPAIPIAQIHVRGAGGDDQGMNKRLTMCYYPGAQLRKFKLIFLPESLILSSNISPPLPHGHKDGQMWPPTLGQMTPNGQYYRVGTRKAIPGFGPALFQRGIGITLGKPFSFPSPHFHSPSSKHLFLLKYFRGLRLFFNYLFRL